MDYSPGPPDLLQVLYIMKFRRVKAQRVETPSELRRTEP